MRVAVMMALMVLMFLFSLIIPIFRFILLHNLVRIRHFEYAKR